MATINASIKPVLDLERTSDTPGFAQGAISAHLPARQFGNGYVAKGGNGPAVVIAGTKAWAATIALSASTPLELDLADLPIGLGVGDLAFADVTLIDVRSNAAPGSGPILTLGGSGGASEWFAPFGAAEGATLPVPAGTVRQIYMIAEDGWPVDDRKILRLDPGAAPHPLTLVIVGH